MSLEPWLTLGTLKPRAGSKYRIERKAKAQTLHRVLLRGYWRPTPLVPVSADRIEGIVLNRRLANQEFSILTAGHFHLGLISPGPVAVAADRHSHSRCEATSVS